MFLNFEKNRFLHTNPYISTLVQYGTVQYRYSYIELGLPVDTRVLFTFIWRVLLTRTRARARLKTLSSLLKSNWGDCKIKLTLNQLKPNVGF